LISVAIATCSKPPCECDFVPKHYIDCKLTNQQGQNLVFGSSAIYITDSIQVLKSDNNLSINNASVRKSLDDSFSLRFDFYIEATRSFIYYKYQTKTDTLDIAWSEKTGKCCGSSTTYYVPGEVKFNGALIQPTNGVYYFVK
jgi:hypothetical protein